MITNGRQSNLVRVCIFTASLIISASALAQAALEEIVVTAQKRDQSLSDVPVSVQVLSGETFIEQGLNTLEDAANRAQLRQLRDHLGFERNVIVQATCLGSDNRALVDALVHSDGTARGVASVRRDVTDDELQALHDAGVRGIRFNFVKRLVDLLPTDALQEIAERIGRLGMHLVIYLEAEDLPELEEMLASLPGTVVFDHMGRPDVRKGADSGEFDRFIDLMGENENMWAKVSCPERLSISGPPAYDDVVPFARRVVATFPDRVLWGTDWPHPNMKSHMPDDGKLVDYIPRIAASGELQHKLLVRNPMTLYWPEEASHGA